MKKRCPYKYAPEYACVYPRSFPFTIGTRILRSSWFAMTGKILLPESENFATVVFTVKGEPTNQRMNLESIVDIVLVGHKFHGEEHRAFMASFASSKVNSIVSSDVFQTQRCFSDLSCLATPFDARRAVSRARSLLTWKNIDGFLDPSLGYPLLALLPSSSFIVLLSTATRVT